MAERCMMVHHQSHPFLEERGLLPSQGKLGNTWSRLGDSAIFIANLLKQINFKACLTSTSENSTKGTNIHTGQMRLLLCPSHLECFNVCKLKSPVKYFGKGVPQHQSLMQVKSRRITPLCLLYDIAQVVPTAT